METELRRLLYSLVKRFATNEGLKVSWPNKDFDNKNLEVYLKVDVMPVDPRVLTVCSGGSEYKWILQVSIYVTEGHERGEIIATDLVDKLRLLFPVAKKLTGNNCTFRIIKPANPAPPLTSAGWFYIPVSIRLQTIN